MCIVGSKCLVTGSIRDYTWNDTIVEVVHNIHLCMRMQMHAYIYMIFSYIDPVCNRLNLYFCCEESWWKLGIKNMYFGWKRFIIYTDLDS